MEKLPTFVSPTWAGAHGRMANFHAAKLASCTRHRVATCDHWCVIVQRSQSDAPVSSEQLEAAYKVVAAFLEPQIDEIVADVEALLREQIPAYGAEPAGARRADIRAILAIALDQAGRGRAPDAMNEAIATLARQWAADGRPLDQRSVQLGARRVAIAVVEHAPELNLDEHVLLAMQGASWDWATTCASILAEAQRDHEVAAARRDAAARAGFLRDLAAGRITAARLAHEAEAFGLDVNRCYFALQAECPDAATASTLEAHIRRSGATDTLQPLEVVLNSRLIAIAPQVPTEHEGVTLAVGRATLLHQAQESFSEAAEALNTARAFGITGVVDLGTLGPLPLVTEAEPLAERLSERHLNALDAQGPAGVALEETIRTLLDHDRNVEATAAALHVHRNTIRHRMNRFHVLTGLDLRVTQDLVAAWWLLKRRQAARASADRDEST